MTQLETRIVELCAIAPYAALDIRDAINRDRPWWRQISLGKVYILANRLERLGYLKSYWGETVEMGMGEYNPRRKYYRATGKSLPDKRPKVTGLRLGLG